MNSPLTPEQLAELQALIAQNQKIPAIKRYREITGQGLAEAKQAVEQMETGHLPAPTIGNPSLTADQVAIIRELLQRGQKIEAIKKYRDLTGAGLAEAKAAVEQLEAGSSAPMSPAGSTPARKSGCFALIVAVAGAIAGTLAALLLWLRHG